MVYLRFHSGSEIFNLFDTVATVVDTLSELLCLSLETIATAFDYLLELSGGGTNHILGGFCCGLWINGCAVDCSNDWVIMSSNAFI